MKIECPICHVEGLLQQRGKSSRIQHYMGFENGKRVYQYHKVVGMEVNGSNGSKSMEVKEAQNTVLSKNLSQLSCEDISVGG